MKPMRAIVIVSLVLASCNSKTNQAPISSKADEASIQSVLDQQVAAWNETNIDEFMKGYYKSDSILFILINRLIHQG